MSTPSKRLKLSDLKAVGAATEEFEIPGRGKVDIRAMTTGALVTLSEEGIDPTDQAAWPYVLADTLMNGTGKPMCKTVDDARAILDNLPVGVGVELMNRIGELTEADVKVAAGKSPGADTSG